MATAAKGAIHGADDEEEDGGMGGRVVSTLVRSWVWLVGGSGGGGSMVMVGGSWRLAAAACICIYLYVLWLWISLDFGGGLEQVGDLRSSLLRRRVASFASREGLNSEKILNMELARKR